MDEPDKLSIMSEKTNDTGSTDKSSDETMIHQMRCMEALGRWSDLNKLSESAVEHGLFNPEDSLFKWADVDKRQKVAQM
jgi:hypothetical protein